MDSTTRKEHLKRYWFSVGEIAFAEGLSVDDACGFEECHPNRERFLQGWNHARLDHEAWLAANHPEELKNVAH